MDEKAAGRSRQMTSFEISLKVPETKVPIIDEYYRTVDTANIVSKLCYKTEFDRLQDKVEGLWHAKKTPISEVDTVRPRLKKIFEKSIESDNQAQTKGLYQIEQYMSHVKKHHRAERLISTCFDSRQRALQDFVQRTFHCVELEEFEFLAVQMAL